MLGQVPGFWDDLQERVDAQVVTPSERVTHAAMLGALGGGALAAILGLTGEIIRPGNRMAVMTLIALPVATTGLGLVMATRQNRRL